MNTRLYAVCDAEVCTRAGWRLSDFAAACLAGGATLLQVRAKTLGSRDFLAAARVIVARAAAADATVIVNDRADIARLSGAAGVHLGQDDLSPGMVRPLIGAGAQIGLSTHTRAQIDASMSEPVQYIAIGPVFATRTKATGYNPVGLSMVAGAAAMASSRGRDLVAIGGITLENAADVIAAGASAVAVISDLLVGNDPAARTRACLERLSRV